MNQNLPQTNLSTNHFLTTMFQLILLEIRNLQAYDFS